MNNRLYFLLNNEGYTFSGNGHVLGEDYFRRIEKNSQIAIEKWIEIEFDVAPYIKKIKQWKAKNL